MKLSKLAIALTILCTQFSTYALAADQVAKEETTPPAAEGPISPDEIPPISGQDTSAQAPAAMQTPAATPAPTAAPAMPPTQLNQPPAAVNPNSSDSTNVVPNQATVAAPAPATTPETAQ